MPETRDSQEQDIAELLNEAMLLNRLNGRTEQPNDRADLIRAENGSPGFIAEHVQRARGWLADRWRKESTPTNTGRKKRFRTRAEDRDAPPPKWLVEGLIPENADVAIYAPSQFLKSFVALDITYSIATACQALGRFPVNDPGPVFYFAGEGYHSMAKKRATAWEVGHGVEPYSVDSIYIGDGVLVSNDNELIEADLAEMEEILGDRRCKMFVIDTMNRSLNGQDEDKSHVASRYLQTMKMIRDRVGGTSFTVAHMGKDPDRGERGSSAFAAGFDTILWIEQVHKDESTGVITLQILVRKQKDADDGHRLWLKSDKVSIPEGEVSLVLRPIDAEEAKLSLPQGKGGKISVPVETYRQALIDLVPHGGSVTSKELKEKMESLTGKNQKFVEKDMSCRSQSGGDLYKYKKGYGHWCLPLYEQQPISLQASLHQDPLPNGADHEDQDQSPGGGIFH